MPELTEAQRAALLGVLGRARDLGFLGPGALEPHLDHAQVFVEALGEVSGPVVDLGSGGGLPGLVIGLARPDLHLVLLDARGVRCRFLEEAAAALGLDADVVEGRAEQIGRGPHRGAAAAVVARSFGPPAATAECGAPLLQVGGRLVVSEPPGPVERRWPDEGLARLGLRAAGTVRRHHATVRVFTLEAACSDEFPRRDGIPAKRPLF